MNASQMRGREGPGRAAADDPFGAFAARVSRAQALQEIRAEEIEEAARRIGERLGPEVKAAQLRHVLDETVRIRMDARRAGVDFRAEVRPRVVLLKPRLAYQAGREARMRSLCDLLSAMIDRVRDERDFEEFAEFVQGVVAYHRYYGGHD